MWGKNLFQYEFQEELKRRIFLQTDIRLVSSFGKYFDNCWSESYKNFYFHKLAVKLSLTEDDDLQK